MMFATIADSAALYYKSTTSAMNTLVLEYLVLYIPMGFLVPWMLSRYGLRTNFMIAALGNAIGSFGKYGITFLVSPATSLIFAYVFQAMNALVQVIILSSPTLFVALWFGESERVIANMIASVSGSVGLVVVSMTAPLIVPEGDSEAVPTLLWIFGVPSVVGFVLVWLFVKDRPPSPPSPNAQETAGEFRVRHDPQPRSPGSKIPPPKISCHTLFKS
jgi:MFS family permease